MNSPATRTTHNTCDNDEQLQDLLKLKPVPFDAKRIKQQVFDRLGYDAATAAAVAQDPSRPQSQRQPRRLSRRLTVTLVAAAVMIIGISSAFAANNLIATMGESGIGFFGTAGFADKDLNKPTYYVSMQADLEKANAPVGQAISFEGGTITLDTLAVDNNFLNAFYTIRYDEPISTEGINEGLGAPEWFGLHTLTSILGSTLLTVDGEDVHAYPNYAGAHDVEYDPYYIDGHTIGIMTHQVIAKDLPDVFDLNISLPGNAIPVAVAGSTHFDSRPVYGSFEVTVDKGAPAALTRSIAPGTYRFEGARGIHEVTIERLSLTPFGVVAIVRAQDFDDIGSLMIVDDRGNAAAFQFRGGTFGWSAGNQAPYYGDQSYIFELVGLDPQTQSITITPVIYETTLENFDERRLVDLSQAGTQIALSELGGVTLVSREVEQGTVTVKLRPYGFLGSTSVVGGGPGGGNCFVLEDTEDLMLNGDSGIVTSWYDRGDNLIVFTQDFSDIDDGQLEQLKQLTTYGYTYFNGISADEGAALTLPLG
ncbi:MAG: DUF4179 domain-containing protein [Coriobacteriales bacterium]|jgi:hypothetical protein|nr:DUF4179 domain-containing protein [Coriobacteriales bacterium]